MKEAFDTYYADLMHYAGGIVGENAHDIIMDLFIKWNATDELLKEKTNIRSFVFSSVKNRCIDFIRREKTKEAYAKTIPEHPTEEDLSDGRLIMIDMAIEALPTATKEVILLSFFGGLNAIKISIILNKPVNTVRNLKMYGLVRLREIFKIKNPHA